MPDDELINAIENLIAALNNLSSKSVTPADIEDIVTGFAVKFGLVSLGTSDTWTNNAGNKGIAYDGTYFYIADGSNAVGKTQPGGTLTAFCMSSSITTIGHLAWDSDKDYLYAGQDDVDTISGGVDAKIETYDSDGNLVYSKTISNPVLPPSELNILGLSYDATNSKLYILYWGPTYDILRYGEINPETGVISNYHDLPGLFQSATSMFCYAQILFIIMPNEIYGYPIGNTVPITIVANPGETYLGIDSTTGLLFAPNTTSVNYYGFTHVQRVSPFDDGGITQSVDDGGGSLTVDSTSYTTMITSLQKIDDLQNALKSVNTDQLVVEQEPAPSVADSNVSVTAAATLLVASRASRRGLLIQNADTVNTVWIGDNGVTTATGIELLPKQSLPLNNFTGATANVYGICAAGKTADVRILEAF